MEKFLYEGRPYFYAIISLGAFFLSKSHASKVLFLCGVLLALSSYMVFRVRKDYRTSSNRLRRFFIN